MSATAPTELVPLPGGRFEMGSERFYPDEGPVHAVHVDGLAVERHPVTNAQFSAFVSATGYSTVAERPLDPALYPGLDPAELTPGSLVFRPTDGPVDLRDWRRWWHWVPGASWRQPTGPGSDLAGRGDHPVVQVAHEDAAAYAGWAGRRLPTEAEWEYAARAGATTDFAWGDEAQPGGRVLANTWQGRFPYDNHGAAGWVGTSPVGTFPANDFGLVDLIGNVWEWTTTPYRGRHPVSSCCAPSSPATSDASNRLVLKGGSHLCAPEYCLRYRPAARSPQTPDSATTHIGFRCVADG